MEAPPFIDQDSLRRHAFAVSLVGLGLAWKLWLGDGTGHNLPLLLALLVTVAAWHGGLGPGLLATTTAAAVAVYFVIPPLHSFRIGSASGWLELATFAAAGILVSLLCEARRRSSQSLSLSRARERAAAADNQVLRREIERLGADLSRAHDDLDHFVQTARRQLERPAEAGAMARGLLDYAAAMRIDRCQPVNCNEVVEAAMAQTGAVVTHDPLPTIRGDAAQMRALFVRLFTNGAVRPTAHIAAGYQGDGWTFRISYREDHTCSDAVTRRIVEGHDGEMRVEPRQGAGTTVRIHIPRRPRG